MNPVKIEANQYSLYKVFSNDFIFTIPLYQRPYAWTTEQAEELLDDLITSLGDDNESIDEVNPYFLGTIVLIKGDKPDAQVVDGQQRLTTLTILISVIRSLVPEEQKHRLTKYLYQEADSCAGIPSGYRLTLGNRDADFFQEYIQNESGIDKLAAFDNAKLSDSRINIKENALCLKKILEKLDDIKFQRLIQFMIQKCVLVVVSTADFESAYRIFSVLNNRGLDLSHADIFKADIIGQIYPERQDIYSYKWEEIEGKLGREDFKSLFSYIRMIHAQSKPREGIIKEFYKSVQPNPKEFPQEFIDKELIPFGNALCHIKNQSYKHSSKEIENKINQSFRWLGEIDNSDWIPPAILYLSKNDHKPELLVDFFTDLDRLASGLMIIRANINQRIERYSKLLQAIKNEENLYTSNSPLQLQESERQDILTTLNGDIYLMIKIGKYVLLRLDTALSDGSAEYKFKKISVEHVLPQNPKTNSEWLKNIFTEEEHEKYVHCLGNLVLLSRKKNTAAQNHNFETKKKKYFINGAGVSPFALTTQVLIEKEWTPAVIKRRQKQLINTLKQLWRLN